MKIELLSDMCVSDGGVYNSAIDTDVCHDSFGFPYIPAKRIRGCLRECGIELRDWGVDINIEKIFGTAGKEDNRAAVRIGNAYLENYEKMKQEALVHQGHVVYHPQNILSHYSYVRTQTSLNYETGAADDASLRTMRVVNKGLVFVADIDIYDDFIKGALENCIDLFTSIGIARTRGLGQIRAYFIDKIKGDSEGKKNIGNMKNIGHIKYIEGSEILNYELELKEPVICKSVNGGETRTLDYIEGSKILGLIAAGLKQSKKDVIEFLNEGELICSNAYISESQRRYTEVPANYYTIKNVKDCCIDKLRLPEPQPEDLKDKQLNMMKHTYVYKDKETIYKKDVLIEERYHHRRPDDKSIGRAQTNKEEESGGEKEAHFYQMSSIEAGQKFAGYVKGTKHQIKQIYDVLSRQNIYYLGYSHSSEYGRVELRIQEFSKDFDSIDETCDEFFVKLAAPTIVYNKEAFYSTNAQDLIEEITTLLELDLEIVEKLKADEQDGSIGKIKAEVSKYINYTTVGGYNVTWNKRKPIIEAFDKGSVLHFKLDKPIKIKGAKTLFLGERISEGYGEAVVQIISKNDTENYKILIEDKDEVLSNKQVDASVSEFASAMCRDLLKKYLGGKAAEKAADSGITDAAKPVVSNMLLMCKEYESFQKISEAVSKRYERNTDLKEEKNIYANQILSECKNEICPEIEQKSILRSFEKEYGIMAFDYNADECQYIYLSAYLNQLKYSFRPKKQSKEVLSDE